MAKADTVALYEADFLEGKTQEAIDRFKNKSVDKQYASIMAWRFKKRKLEASTGSSISGVIEYIRGTKARVRSLAMLTTDDINRIEEELVSLENFMDEMRELHRENEIKQLEEESMRISQRLAQLKGE
jgi:hypothetical protein